MDDFDIVGLFCVYCVKEGGESDIVSIYYFWNIL